MNYKKNILKQLKKNIYNKYETWIYDLYWNIDLVIIHAIAESIKEKLTEELKG